MQSPPRPSTAFLVASLIVCLGAYPALAQQAAYQTSAPTAFLVDMDTGSTLFEKAPDQLVVPASTAKLMTAEVVFREIAEGRLKLSDEFTVSENAWRTGGALARGSSMFAALHSRVKVEDLIRGLVIVSGNDAAIILAEGIAGTEAAFAQRMNQRAGELGLAQLSFRNAWGKDDPNQRVSARDMVLLANHIIKTYPDLYRYFAEREFTWSKIKQQNRNPLLTMDVGADGLKTGNIDEASGFGIVASAVQNGQRLTVAMYGLRNGKERADEARKILQWGFRSFESRSVFAAGETVGSARVFGGAQMEVPLVTASAVRVLVPRGSNERLSGNVVYEGPVPAPIEPGQPIGRLRLARGALPAVEVPLRAGESVPIGSLMRRAFDGVLELGQGLFRTYVLKNG